MIPLPLPGELLEPWEAVHPDFKTKYEERLQDLLPPGSPLKGLTCSAIARRADRDDFLFQTPLPDSAYAVVDLYDVGPKGEPAFVESFTTWEGFCLKRMVPDHEDWMKWS